MSSARSDLTATRLVTAATVVLAIAIAILGAFLLWDDIQDRRDQQAHVEGTNDEALAADLDELRADIERTLATVDVSGTELAAMIAASSLPSEAALQSAVVELNLGSTIRSIDRVIYQDSVGQVFGVDGFGATTMSPEGAGFDSRIAVGRAIKESFVDGQSQTFLSDGLAAYYPVGDGASDGWAVLIVSGDALAVDAMFTRLGPAGSTQSGVNFADDTANIVAAVPFADSEFVATRQVAIATEAAPGWMSFILKALGTLVALGAVFTLGYFGSRNQTMASPHVGVPESVEYGARSDFEQNIIGVVELDETGIIVSANQSYCDQVRRDRSDLVGTSLLALTEPADRTRHLAAVDKLIAGTARTTQVEHRVITDSETEVWVLEHLSRTDSGGEDPPRILVQS